MILLTPLCWAFVSCKHSAGQPFNEVTVYRYALDVPLRMQWDSSSRQPAPEPGTAPGNCGVTCVTMMAEYYRDTFYSIYATRRLAVSNNAQMFTTINEQKLMLAFRGVPCYIARPSVAGLTSLVASGKRPVLIGLNMAQVPQNIAGHPFRGNHAVLLRANATINGVPGKLVADPNFSPYTNRLDPTNGRRFYPDWVIQNAYYNQPMWALVPDKDKVVSGGAPSPVPPSGVIRGDGDPYPMRMRSLVQPDGVVPSYRLRAGKPLRTGATVSSSILATVPGETRIFPVSYIDKDDLPAPEQKYGNVKIVLWYAGNGYRFAFVKDVDLA